MLRIFSFVPVLLLLVSCQTPPADAVRVRDRSEIPTIQQAERSRLEKLAPGMKWDDVRAIFPELYPVSMDKETQAFELARVVKYVDDFDASWSTKVFQGGSRGSVDRQVLWFYVVQGTLIKWGNPRDWPTKSEIERLL